VAIGDSGNNAYYTTIAGGMDACTIFEVVKQFNTPSVKNYMTFKA